MLYLTKTGLLDIPILYLSRAINQSKTDYYRLLQAVRDDGAWQEWVIYILTAVSQTAQSTLGLVEEIRILMAEYKRVMRSRFPKIYSQDLLNNLFRHPYTRIEYVQHDLGVSRLTASKYLRMLADGGLLQEHQSGSDKYFINAPLVALFAEASDQPV